MELVRAEAGTRAGGFVNAVLRRVGERDEPAWVAAARARRADEDPVGHAAFAHAHPRWIAQAFADALGAATRRRAGRRARRRRRPPRRAPARPPRRDHRGRAGAGDRRRARRRTRPTGCTSSRAAATSVSSTRWPKGLADRAGRGQPAGRARPGPRPARPARTAAAGSTCAPAPAARRRCSAALAAHRRRHRSTPSSRASTAPTWCAGPPTGCRSPCTSADGRDAPLPDGGFDRVLVDAPCTGLGALRRRPEARWRRQPDGRRPGLTDAAARAAHRRAAARAPRRRGGLRDLLAAPGRDGRACWPAVLPHGTRACERLDARELPARRAGPRRRPDRAALAAPARHRRDVPRAAAARTSADDRLAPNCVM